MIRILQTRWVAYGVATLCAATCATPAVAREWPDAGGWSIAMVG